MDGPIYPELLGNSEVDPSGHYVCPLCRTQTAADREDIGWVRCPMVYGKPIGLGCCIDFQGVALSDHFETHSLHNLFGTAANFSGEDVTTIQQICLNHQEAVAKEKLESIAGKSMSAELKEHLTDNYIRLLQTISLRAKQ